MEGINPLGWGREWVVSGGKFEIVVGLFFTVLEEDGEGSIFSTSPQISQVRW